MRIHALYHEPYEGPGNIKNWADMKGYRINSTSLYNKENLPDTDDFDMLLIMGGSMSVNDEKKYSWLKKEKNLIRESVNKNKAILGICLGAQLISSALGGKVYKNNFMEIGWFPVQFKNTLLNNQLKKILPEELTVFHWHGETFENPPGAIGFASSEATANQAFISGSQVIGLQFHLEMTVNDIKEICNAGKAMLTESSYVQNANQIFSQMHYVEAGNKLMYGILNYLEGSFLHRNN
jgi:GMP synthase (glutamine-hydrolysing)